MSETAKYNVRTVWETQNVNRKRMYHDEPDEGRQKETKYRTKVEHVKYKRKKTKTKWVILKDGRPITA